MLTKSIIAALSLLLGANAHLFLQSPVPMQGNAIKDPLDASGSNFPCHGVAIPASGGTSMAAGSSQKLIFEDGNGANTAVHGGGSCQVSITYETDAAKVKDPSNWHVIYSIEGGCPSLTHGNLEDGKAVQCTSPDQTDCLNQFSFTIPKGVKEGHATLAWTWFNTIGNREMYMNCVSTDITGGDGSEMSDFPSMFVANLASVDTCPTISEQNVKFPNPGKYVTTVAPSAAPSSDLYPIAVPTGAGCAADGGAAGSTASGSSASGGAPAGASATATASSAATSSAAGSATNAVASSTAALNANAPITMTTLATVTGSASGPAASGPAGSMAVSSAAGTSAAGGIAASSAGTSAAGGMAAPSAAGTSAAAPSTGASSGTATGSCSGGAVACTSNGSVVCIGSSQFGLCDNGCAVPQALAAGTTCSDGVVGKRNISRHVRKHLVHA